MIRLLIVIAVTAWSDAIEAQPAVVEIEGVIWERSSPYVANSDSLQLHKQPDLRSETGVIPYRAGWRIPVSGLNGMTRVLSVGELRVTKPDDHMICSVQPEDGPADLVQGELVEYLRYIGEGFGEIRFRGATCQAEVAEMLGHFELIRAPEVQLWYPVYYADGTSPGWLLHDGTQTR
jgi:hypothetical protein